MRRKPQTKVTVLAGLPCAGRDAAGEPAESGQRANDSFSRSRDGFGHHSALSERTLPAQIAGTILLACGLALTLNSVAWAQQGALKGRVEVNSASELDLYAPSDIVSRDRKWQRTLTNAEAMLQSNRLDEAIELLQRCFEAPEDAFVLRPEWTAPTVRGIAAKLLRDAGEPAWKNYERLFGAEARQALERIETEGPAGAYQGVIRRYEHSLAGATALDRLANWQLGRGDYESAVTCWEQLLSNPVHAPRVTTVQRLKLFFAANRSGRTDIARREAEYLDKTRIAIAGQTQLASEWRAKLELLPLVTSRPTTDWRLFGGTTERNRVNQGSAPFLLRPSATVSMFDAGPRPSPLPEDRRALLDGRTQCEKDFENALNSGKEMGFAGTPIVKDNSIIWRDSFGLRAIDRQTRETLWAYPTETRLHSLLVFNTESEFPIRGGQSTYRQNSVLEQLTSDGQHIYFVDQNSIPDRLQGQFLFDQGDLAQRNDGKMPTVPWNCIVALKLKGPGAGKVVAWKLGGHPTEDQKASLAGHYFVAPPVPLGGLLYCIAEYQKQIWLIAVHPDNGSIEWRQTLSLAPQPSRESPLPPDKMRLAPACLLAASRGVLVCPLASGILVGVNQLTGEILWAYDYRVRRKGPQFQYGLAHNSYEQFNEGDFPNPPLIHNDRVYFLAPGENSSTDHVICLDLNSGKKVWQVETTIELRYLAVASQDLVVGIGGNDALGLSALSGDTIWSRRVPRMSGVGATIPGVYLLPIADGRVLSLNLRDGSEIGFAMQASQIRPGNLVISGTDVISLNGLDLQVFPQSAELLASMEAKPDSERTAYQFWYELGELQFRMGQIIPAKTSLLKALGLADPSTQSAIRGMLRDLAWHELLQQPDQRPRILDDYAVLCELPEHRAQHLLLKAEEELRRGNLTQARQTSLELMKVDANKPLRLLADPDRHLTASVWVGELVRKSAVDQATADFAPPTTGAIDELLRRADRRALGQFLEQYPSSPRAAEVRLLLAKLLVQDGQGQAAELLVWQDHLGTDAAALAACRFLLEVWDAAGLYEESGLLLHWIGTRLEAVRGADGITGRDFYANYSRDSLAWAAAQRFVPPNWRVDTVQISEEHEIDLKLRGTFNTAPRYVHFPQSSQQLIIRGQSPANLLQQIDSETGAVIADITLPPGGVQNFFPHFDARNRIGHYLPLGGAANCYGISLLERSLAWHRASTPELRLNNLVRVGPTTPQISIFRTRDRLLGLSPVSGNLLWERSDLEETGRAIPNALTSVPGDAEVIVLLESESKTYRVFKTSDGSFVRQGKLANCFYIHQQFGRNLLYSTDNSMRNIQLWDPLHDKVLFEATGMASIVGVSERDPEFTVADTFGKVRVVEGLTGRVKIQINLNPLDFQPPQQPAMLKSFTDGTRYYVNVHRQLQVMANSTFHSDAIFPTQQITGDLHAVDPATSRLLWTRTKVLPQNVVHMADYRLPFLVTLSRGRGSPRGNSQTSLRIDVIDGATGATLAGKHNAFNDRLFLMDYDRTAGRIRFRGAITQIHLDFGRKVNPPEPGSYELVGR